MNQQPVKMIETSHDPRELTTAAAQLARSDQPRDHDVLLKALRSEKFLATLNTEEEYNYYNPRALRVRRIFDELVKNNATCARNTILELTKNPVYLKKENRVVVLIQATGVVRPAPPELISFWDKYSDPEAGYVGDIIEAALENGSRPALEFFETKVVEAKYEDDEKFDWLRTSVLTRRNQLGVLTSCQKLFNDQALAEHLKLELVDIIFDYKPNEWYRPSGGRNPPPNDAYSDSARDQLRKLAQDVLKWDKLTKRQQEAVEKMLKELETDPQS